MLRWRGGQHRQKGAVYLAASDFLNQDVTILHITTVDEWNKPVISTVRTRGRYQQSRRLHVNQAGEGVYSGDKLFLGVADLANIAEGDEIIVDTVSSRLTARSVAPKRDKMATLRHIEVDL